MKYLLACPHCGSKIPVTTGQAGQLVQCTCGQNIEVPSIRALRELEPLVEQEEAPLPTWSARQGIVFLGLAITIIAVLASAALVALRPSITDQQLTDLPINKEAIQQEVQALSPAEAYLRFEPIVNSIHGYTDLLAQAAVGQGAVPPHLMADLSVLSAFEGAGPQPLAPKASADLAQQAQKRGMEIYSRLLQRRMMNDWMLLIAIVGVVGLLVAGSALIFSTSPPPRRAVKAAARAPQRR